MTEYETIRNRVTTLDAAEMYGISVSRSGMAVCPFHDDHDPSMKIDRRFHCFGCGADGDVIDFTSRLFNIPRKDAANKLSADFGITENDKKAEKRIERPSIATASLSKAAEQETVRLLADYLHLLNKWEQTYAPHKSDESWHPRFIEAIQYKAKVENAVDLFVEESAAIKSKWIESHREELEQLKKRRDYFMSEKPSNKERLKEITDSIAVGITELFESEKYKQYLSVMSRFHRYSVNNTMLIYMQNPDASLVAGYNKWQKQFERHVKKGERGITIIAPTPYKKRIEEQKRDPETNAPLLDKDGNVITEEKEIEIPMFRPVKVFDVSQTDGKPIPQIVESLHGEVKNYDTFMAAVTKASPVPIQFESMSNNTDGFFDPTNQRIALRTGMSEVQTVSAAIHEITHSKLHNKEIPTEIKQWDITMVGTDGTQRVYSHGYNTRDDAENAAADVGWSIEENGKHWDLKIDEGAPVMGFVEKDRRTQEVEAESVSYAVCQYYGIETKENSLGYIASWSAGKDLKELRDSLETINKTASTLIEDIDRNYRLLCVEREQDTVAKRHDNSIPTHNIAKIDFLAYDGSISETTEYSSQEQFERDLKECTHNGVPLSVTLYRDTSGNTIPHDFIFALDPPPKALYKVDNPLKNAEMSLEDDYGMIDGIINNGKAPGTLEPPKDAKTSVIDKLKSQSKSEPRRSHIKKEKGREI